MNLPFFAITGLGHFFKNANLGKCIIFTEKNTTLFIKQDAVFSLKGFDMLPTAGSQLELSGRKK